MYNVRPHVWLSKVYWMCAQGFLDHFKPFNLLVRPLVSLVSRHLKTVAELPTRPMTVHKCALFSDRRKCFQGFSTNHQKTLEVIFPFNDYKTMFRRLMKSLWSFRICFTKIVKNSLNDVIEEKERELALMINWRTIKKPLVERQWAASYHQLNMRVFKRWRYRFSNVHPD